jgi:hypothetical protein
MDYRVCDYFHSTIVALSLSFLDRFIVGTLRPEQHIQARVSHGNQGLQRQKQVISISSLAELSQGSLRCRILLMERIILEALGGVESTNSSIFFLLDISWLTLR